MAKPLPTGLKTFEPSDTVRRTAQNENIEATDALFHPSTGHHHTGKPGDAPQIGTDGIAGEAVTAEKIAQSSIVRRHLRTGQLSINIAKNKAVTVSGGEVGGVPTAPYYDYWGDRNYWLLFASYAPLPQSITINLEREYYDLEGLSFETADGQYPSEFFVETTRDGKTWKRVYTFTSTEIPPLVQRHYFQQLESATHVRITITKASDPYANVFLTRISVYSARVSGSEEEALSDRKTWGIVARTQGLMIMPMGSIIDYGLASGGSIRINDHILIMNPASGTYFYVEAGTYVLTDWSYLYVDIPLYFGDKQIIKPQVKVWDNNVEKPRLYDHPHRIVLAQRCGKVFFNSALTSSVASFSPNADKVNGIQFMMNNGSLQYNDGSGWKGVGIKSVQRGATNISYFYPNGNGSLVRDVTINPVNPAKSFVNFSTSGLSHWFQTSPMMDGSVCGRLVGNNTVRFNFYDGFYEAYAEIAWEVIEFA